MYARGDPAVYVLINVKSHWRRRMLIQLGFLGEESEKNRERAESSSLIWLCYEEIENFEVSYRTKSWEGEH